VLTEVVGGAADGGGVYGSRLGLKFAGEGRSTLEKVEAERRSDCSGSSTGLHVIRHMLG
jgi:hypothetical protein